MNQVTLVGRIANDLELKQTQTGKMFCQFNLAVTRFGGEGADFVPVQAWNKAAENLVKFQVKGSQIAVNGRLNVETYETEGQKRTFTKVIANEVEFLGSKPQEKTVAEVRYEQKKMNNEFMNAMSFVNDESLPF